MRKRETSSRPPDAPQLARVRYRVGQFIRGFFASQLSDDEAKIVVGVLPADATALFDEMPVDAQRHSVNVLHMLRNAGYDDADLDAAALLHDVGKVEAQRTGVSINLWMRGPLVMAEAVSPETLRRQADPVGGTGWRYALYVHFEHPRIGAEWAREAGCSDLTCWLIAHHQDVVDPDGATDDVTDGEADDATDDGRYQLLTALQWADGLN